MDYKRCEYWKNSEEKGHCPFSKVCKDSCYFSLKELESSYEELEEEIDGLRSELWEAESFERELKDTEKDLDRLEADYDELWDFTKKLLCKLLEETDEVPVYNGYNVEILRYLNYLEEQRKNKEK